MPKKRSNRNLADLTTELLRDFLATNLILESSKEVDPEDEQKELLERCKEKPRSMTTFWQEMRQLGCKHSARKNSFCVDGHERAEQRLH
jgi:hypothetical protein